MKRFLVAIPRDGGGIELFAMKEWLRQHPAEVPQGLDATASTSHALRSALRRRGWSVQESEAEVRMVRPIDSARIADITEVLGEAFEDYVNEAAEDELIRPSFGLEHQLRDFLADNLARIPIAGRTLQLYVDPAGNDGIEYATAVGRIDLLAVDPTGGFVVFELKRATAPDKAVGQLARYMGWVKNTIGRGRAVIGIIVAKSIDERLRYAASVIPGVTLLEYQVEFHLTEANELASSSQSSE